MYGFSKVMHLQQGVLKAEASDESEMLEFRNENFHKDQPDLLIYIHRKKSEKAAAAAGHEERALLTAGPSSAAGAGSGDGSSSALALDLRTVLSDIAAIRKHQTSISTELKDISTSNKQLWSEAVASRERHQRHQDTINKIVRFLGEVFGGKVVEASDLGLGRAAAAAQETPPSASSSPDSNGEAGPSHASAVNHHHHRHHHHHQPRKANRRTLLIKGPEEQPGSGQITEIEVPDEDDMESLPTISGESYIQEQPLSSSTSRASTAAAQDGGASTSTSAMLPSPIASPTHHLPFSTASTGFPGLSAPDSASRNQILLPFLQQQQQQGSSSGFTPPPSFTGPDPAQERRVDKSQRDYRALESEMVHLQTKIDKLIAQLPPHQQSQLKDSTSLGLNGTSNGDYDFDAFLSQLTSQQQEAPQLQPQQQHHQPLSVDSQTFGPAPGDGGSLEWMYDNHNNNNSSSGDGNGNGNNPDSSRPADFYDLGGLADSSSHFNGFPSAAYPGLGDTSDLGRFEDFSAFVDPQGEAQDHGHQQQQQYQAASPTIEVEELDDMALPGQATDNVEKGKKRSATSTRSSARKKSKA